MLSKNPGYKGEDFRKCLRVKWIQKDMWRGAVEFRLYVELHWQNSLQISKKKVLRIPRFAANVVAELEFGRERVLGGGTVSDSEVVWTRDLGFRERIIWRQENNLKLESWASILKEVVDKIGLAYVW